MVLQFHTESNWLTYKRKGNRTKGYGLAFLGEGFRMVSIAPG